jgi:hypothetical protein
VKEMLSEYFAPLLLGTVGLVTAIGGWIFNRQISRIDKVAEELEEHRLYVSNHYATQAGIEELKVGLYGRWDRLEDKVDEFLKTAATSVNRTEFEISKDQLHARINDLEKRKSDKSPN